MFDIKIDSFLSVYKNKSYTKAAEELCITQPAVTQHIKSLERQYGCKLFDYSNRELKPTEEGEVFYKHTEYLKANERLMEKKLKEVKKKSKTLKFAATLTIGEFTIAPILHKFIKVFSDYNVTMYVDNTQEVLAKIKSGDISFALVEGLFNKDEYESRLYKTVRLILTAPCNHPLVNREEVTIKDLKNETIIVREKGSGTREVLERGLFNKNYTLNGFKNIIEIGNVNVIKELVKKGTGISFMYEDAAREEIENGELSEIKISEFSIEREFNFIYLKNNLYGEEIDKFFSFFNME
ncbi:LysR substrate-binding domain-containing protein [Clostridium sp.]|uniref:LysR substrate-binding domain-containing protein n=1 Tax=Clostridium sp. TaxID=1506 RepID=UPI003464CAAF